eukprot:TRINITY_DN1746_c0_g1_i2.p1 TRINITY_DN1746_c0_g1~~TRINITY_DN1746_c0_g1_i2.p1  ORF type:complete len:260 (-),score=37.62 TRINITY_DN1746_c0_g1_i2:83-862(-)
MHICMHACIIVYHFLAHYFMFSNLSRSLNQTGRPMLFSLCEWGDENVQTWGANVAQMYRIQMDHIPFWHYPHSGAGLGYGGGTRDIIEYVGTLNPSTFVRQYGWMDPDFLETMFPITMSFTDSKTEYTFWTLWSAPLIVATDMRDLSADKAYILANPEVISIDQDPSYTAGDRLANNTDGSEVWSRHLFNGDQAVVLFNKNDKGPLTIKVTWGQLGWPQNANVTVRDLWERKDMGAYTQGYSAIVQPHDVFYFRASVEK